MSVPQAAASVSPPLSAWAPLRHPLYRALWTAQLVSTIGGQVHSTWWKGPAADRFRSSWESEFAPTLRRLEAALQEASQEISRRHDALLQAGT